MPRINIGGGGGGGGGAAGLFKENTAKDAIVPVDNADSWVVGSDRMDHDPADTTKNIRAFFNKAKGAFRAGYGTAAQWDDANVGAASFAVGYDTTASASQSFAEGMGTIASGESSHAEGTLSRASGLYSHAEGSATVASGQVAHAEGQSTKAQGAASHAEGQSTTASGSNSHAEGEGTTASGYAAHAEGVGTTASGNASHAEGLWSVASRLHQYAKGAGQFAARGDAQVGSMALLRSTTDATATVLTAEGGLPVLTGAATNVLTPPASRAFQLKISTVARRTDVQGEMAGWTWEGLVGRDATGNARIIGTPVQAAWGDAPATDPWDVAVSINTTDATNNYVAVTVTGQAGKTIRWVAKMEWVEVGG